MPGRNHTSTYAGCRRPGCVCLATATAINSHHPSLRCYLKPICHGWVGSLGVTGSQMVRIQRTRPTRRTVRGFFSLRAQAETMARHTQDAHCGACVIHLGVATLIMYTPGRVSHHTSNYYSIYLLLQQSSMIGLSKQSKVSADIQEQEGGVCLPSAANNSLIWQSLDSSIEVEKLTGYTTVLLLCSIRNIYLSSIPKKPTSERGGVGCTPLHPHVPTVSY